VTPLELRTPVRFHNTDWLVVARTIEPEPRYDLLHMKTKRIKAGVPGKLLVVEP
jgi:hypothetical protein